MENQPIKTETKSEFSPIVNHAIQLLPLALFLQ